MFFFSISVQWNALIMDSDVVEMKLLPDSPVGYGGGPFNFAKAREVPTAFDN